MFKKYVGDVVNQLVDTDTIKATKFINSEYVIRATRKRFGGKIDKRSKTIDIVLTIGKPNYEEREFIKKLRLVREPFPVRKIQLKFAKV